MSSLERGFNAPKKKPETMPGGALAAETLRVSNELQRQLATRRYQQNHPERVIDPNSSDDRNAIMTEWIESGAAADFASEFANGKPEEIRAALAQVKAPNYPETQH